MPTPRSFLKAAEKRSADRYFQEQLLRRTKAFRKFLQDNQEQIRQEIEFLQEADKSLPTALDTVNDQLNILTAAVQQVETTLSGGLNQLITLTAYTNQALYQNDLQNDTIICILEKIAKYICDLVNQSHQQTALQIVIKKNTTAIAEMFATTHADAALARKREQELRQEIEKCCPPEPPAPACQDEPCEAPKPIGPPPQVGPIIE